MEPSRLEILDDGYRITFIFEDLLKYHGRTAIGGVAHGFKVMERALPLLAGGEPPERAGIVIESGFGGNGARDAFEMVTRAVTGGRFRFDPGLAPDAPDSPIGRYFFRVTYEDGQPVDLTLRPGLISDEFLDLAKRGASSPDEEARLAWLKQDMADRLMALPATAVYDATRRTRP
jgi:hypothetical protein